MFPESVSGCARIYCPDKPEYTAGFYQTYTRVLDYPYQYLMSYDSNTNDYLKNNGQLHPIQLQESLPTTPDITTQVSDLTAEEQQMVDLVNQERKKVSLQPLEVDMRLVKVARMKSQDMIDNNYFSHQSPTFGSPFDMMKSQGISYGYAGENLAGNQSVLAAHTSLMNSAGHRANILNVNYKHFGIGIVHGGPYGIMFTQEFID